MRIEICGGIATGKTTLAKRLARDTNFSLVLEDFKANPFWQRFYADREKFVREKNVVFFAQHFGEIKAATSAQVICDYALLQDLAYASQCLFEDHFDIMTRVWRHLYPPLDAPALVVHLECPEEVQLERIRARGRPEEGAITVDYLKSLNDAIRKMIVSFAASPIFSVRSDTVNFATNEIEGEELKRQILRQGAVGD
jgi:deoxyadenosine/deoxycytidine kinase